jgi:hypothetical protein
LLKKVDLARPGQRCEIAKVQKTNANLHIPEQSPGTGFARADWFGPG